MEDHSSAVSKAVSRRSTITVANITWQQVNCTIDSII